ncbi:unnamed protein product [Calypogeia fissa]
MGEGERKGVSEEGEEEETEEGSKGGRWGEEQNRVEQSRVERQGRNVEEDRGGGKVYRRDERWTAWRRPLPSASPSFIPFLSIYGILHASIPLFLPGCQSCAGKTASSCRDSRRQPVPGGRPEFEFLIIKHQTNRMP